MINETPEEELLRYAADWPDPPSELRQRILGAAFRQERNRSTGRHIAAAASVVLAMLAGSLWFQPVSRALGTSLRWGVVSLRTSESPRQILSGARAPLPRSRSAQTKSRTVQLAMETSSDEWAIFDARIQLLRRRARYFGPGL